MENNLEHLKVKAQLEDSILFGNQYREIFKEKTATPTNSPLITNFAALYSSISIDYKLTNFQKIVLKGLFEGFLYIQKDSLKKFHHSYNEVDNELLLHRKSSNGLINIIIHSEESFAFSYIDNTKKEDDKLTFYILEMIDFQQIVVAFFMD